MIKKASKKSWTNLRSARTRRPSPYDKSTHSSALKPTWADGARGRAASCHPRSCDVPRPPHECARTDRRRARRPRSGERCSHLAPPPFAWISCNAACWGCPLYGRRRSNHHERSTSRVLPSAVLRACPCLSVPSTHSLACVARALARTNENLMNIFDFAVGTVRSFCITRTQHGIGIPIRHASTLVTTERF